VRDPHATLAWCCETTALAHRARIRALPLPYRRRVTASGYEVAASVSGDICYFIRAFTGSLTFSYFSISTFSTRPSTFSTLRM
jgi:hypothetical protein